ncbi:MAG: hypothetical protein KC421_13595, partial [Anaerolineales bacterium]|nr:hypothetical protein [Anaerolineales bacterium]
GFQNLTGLTCHQISVNRVSYPVQANGRFSCSDTQFNRLWQAGADTVHACMHDAYMDCPTREQRQYVADAYVQMLVNFAAFGDTKLAARMLRQAAQSQRPNGLIMPAAPGDFARVSSFNIPDFTLYWIMAIEQYVLYSGDTAVLPELYLPVCKAITWFEQFLTADGLLANVPHWVFVDWAELDKRGQVTALNAQFVAALRAAAALARYSGCADDVERFGETAVRVTKAINTHLWDEARGVYVDARHSRRISQQSNAAVIAFGVAPPERWLRILDVIMDAQRLVLTRLGDHDPAATAFDEASDVVLAQPFYAHHLHAALRRVWAAKNAIGVEALAGTFRLKPPLQVYLRRSLRRWEPMPDKNNGLFRETWQVGETTSLCHGWSATPTFDLSVAVLGVQPLTPGFDRTRIAPEPLGLAWAKGAFPTPHGAVVVDWRLENGRFMLNLVIPAGIEAEVTLPGETAVYVVGSGRHQIFNHEGTKD